MSPGSHVAVYISETGPLRIPLECMYACGSIWPALSFLHPSGVCWRWLRHESASASSNTTQPLLSYLKCKRKKKDSSGQCVQVTQEEVCVCVYVCRRGVFDCSCVYLCREATMWGRKEHCAAFFARKSLKPFSFVPASRGWRISLIGQKQESCSVLFLYKAQIIIFKCSKSPTATPLADLCSGLRAHPSDHKVGLTFKCDT